MTRPPGSGRSAVRLFAVDIDGTLVGPDLELSPAVVAARASLGGDGFAESAEIRIYASWATQILSGAKSPMTVLERRLRPEQQWLHQDIRSTIGAAGLCRLDSSIRQPVVATDAGYSKSHDSTDEVIPDDVSAVHH